MNTPERSEMAKRRETELLDLQLRIARRADQLAQAGPGRRSGYEDREFWLKAEKEVFGPEAASAMAGMPAQG